MDLKARRKELNLTMKEVADYIGVSEGTISRWESGNIKNMKRNRIAAYAKVLQVTPQEIMGIEFESEAIIEAYESLNKEGKQRLLDYAKDLLGNKKYTL